MSKKIEKVLNEVLVEITPSINELNFMQNELNQFLKRMNRRIKKLKIDAEFFVGGSFAKNTVTRKSSYDVDIFLRFNPKYKESDYPKLLKKIMRFVFKKKKIHGSRDYYQVEVNPWFCFEIVPVKKIKKPDEAVNITDLSYSHVKYINKKIKKKTITDGIKLAKAFCNSTKTYGAESYIHGFSGYALELLVYNYGNFEKFLRVLSKPMKKKLILDFENYYKKKNIMYEINASKLDSPIILIDPTYKTRNVLAALSEETFLKFQSEARKFLKNPKSEFFRPRKISLVKLKSEAMDLKCDFLVVKTKTSKQEGDIAGTKLLKFHKHLVSEFKKYFEIVNEGFDYLGGKVGRGYFILKRKDYCIYSGPMANDEKNALNFKNERKKTYIQNGRLYAKEKLNFDAKSFLKNWLIQNKRKVKEMYLTKVLIAHN